MHSRSSDASANRDPLAEVIALLRPQTVLSKVISGAGRWAVRYAGYQDAGFCLMLQGSCFLDPEGVGRVELKEGDFVLLPAIPSFTMASDPKMRPVSVAPAPGPVEELRHGTKAVPATMRQLGGYFRFDHANARLLVKLLPSMVLVRRDEPGASRIRRLVELIAEETASRQPGRDLILERLVEVLLVEALRFQPASAAARQAQGLLAGLAVPALARALHRMHEDVALRWTVEELARVAGMSRAVFAERFNQKVGMPPMEYLAEWRIAIAKDLLCRERPPLAELAERVGYQSASAFSTAFTRHAGCSPSAFARSGCEPGLHGPAPPRAPRATRAPRAAERSTGRGAEA
ncbi:MAG: AraC family transcriptional regulator [Labilithrix sp.]|nr:AraC family transcriptional regulator [Labilithrix sp.]MBX3218704.1 AraC family transcriptional regulator [Labilithrix sp.]